jgi:hypothetical protein
MTKKAENIFLVFEHRAQNIKPLAWSSACGSACHAWSLFFFFFLQTLYFHAKKCFSSVELQLQLYYCTPPYWMIICSAHGGKKKKKSILNYILDKAILNDITDG